MKKPLIGLTPSHNTENQDISMRPTYLKALKAAGAIPVVLPLEASREDLAQLVELLDGFLFVGGPDVHPFLFGEETIEGCGNVSLQRDTMELNLLSLAISAQKPILGICRGIQLINIGLGGTIYQDIKSQYQVNIPITHKQPFYYDIPCHTINITAGSALSKLVGHPEGAAIQVNSMHHQAVRTVAPGLVACGLSPDGLVEAVEKPGYPFLLAVQWHPEYLWEKDAAAAILFQTFTQACIQVEAGAQAAAIAAAANIAANAQAAAVTVQATAANAQATAVTAQTTAAAAQAATAATSKT